jgi:hypothetical protein
MINQSILVLGRLAKEPAVHTTAALASLPATAAGLHAIGLTTDLDTAVLTAGLLDAGLWLTLGTAAAFGALGGVVAELLSLHGNIELPHRIKRGAVSIKRSRFADPRNEVDLGIVARMLLGAAAGLALLSIYAPTGPTALVVNALIAGSAATGVFRLVQGRLLGARGQGSAVRDDEEAHTPEPKARKVGAKGQLSVVRSETSVAN